MRSVHYCPATKKTLERKYTDLTSLDAFPSSAIYPTKVSYVCMRYLFFYLIYKLYSPIHLPFYLTFQQNNKWLNVFIILFN